MTRPSWPRQLVTERSIKCCSGKIGFVGTPWITVAKCYEKGAISVEREESGEGVYPQVDYRVWGSLVVSFPSNANVAHFKYNLPEKYLGELCSPQLALRYISGCIRLLSFTLSAVAETAADHAHVTILFITMSISLLSQRRPINAELIQQSIQLLNPCLQLPIFLQWHQCSEQCKSIKARQLPAQSVSN